MKDIETVVSDNIKKLLEKQNINQSELAKIAGVSESTVGKWVLKKASPRMGAIQRISDYFQIPKSYILKEEQTDYSITPRYKYFPTAISAGLPLDIEAITGNDVETISIPNSIMGKWTGDADLFFTRINGDSMNNVMQHNSLIAIKPVELDRLRNNDIVVYAYDSEYAVKRFYRQDNKVIFRPDSGDPTFTDLVIDLDDCLDLKIKGKVVLYIVELD